MPRTLQSKLADLEKEMDRRQQTGGHPANPGGRIQHHFRRFGRPRQDRGRGQDGSRRGRPEAGRGRLSSRQIKRGAKLELFFGQSDSLLIAGHFRRRGGKTVGAAGLRGGAQGLEDDQDFQAALHTTFRDGQIYFWLNLKPKTELYRQARERGRPRPRGRGTPPRPILRRS